MVLKCWRIKLDVLLYQRSLFHMMTAKVLTFIVALVSPLAASTDHESDSSASSAVAASPSEALFVYCTAVGADAGGERFVIVTPVSETERTFWYQNENGERRFYSEVRNSFSSLFDRITRRQCVVSADESEVRTQRAEFLADARRDGARVEHLTITTR